jgi:hypothetical protein
MLCGEETFQENALEPVGTSKRARKREMLRNKLAVARID